jgi:hypothetical protein
MANKIPLFLVVSEPGLFETWTITETKRIMGRAP